VPRAVDSSRDAARTIGVNLGQSVVWLAKPRVNFLLETLWTSGESVVGPDKTLRSQDLYVSPGVRWAYNLKGDLQIVRLAAPPGLVVRRRQGIMFYLSFEQPFALAHSRPTMRDGR
jgi:hypothetical protein